MSGAYRHLNRARSLLGVGKRVLFVEGDDDVKIYGKWLAKIDPLYANRIELVATNGRNDLDKALTALGDPARAFTLRDRDEWDAARIANAQAASPRLLVNVHRHCLESYFCDPDEVMPLLLAQDAATYGPAEGDFRGVLATPLANWVDHWAMWTTAMRLQSDMVSAGYSSYFNHVLPLPGDEEIRTRLQSWSDLAAVDTVFGSFDDSRTVARAQPANFRQRACVHGKKYWDDVVLPALENVHHRADWMIDLAEWSPVPADLEPLLQAALA